jgi:glycosyltransferase involved in cell wall biosynthesis
MKIAIFTETFLPKIDGIVKTLCNLLNHLGNSGHKSILFAPKGAPKRYAKTPILSLPSHPFPLYPDLKLVLPLYNVKDTLTKFKPDIIHLINPISLGLVGLNHAKEMNIPIVASYHTDIPGYTQKYGLNLLEEISWTFLRWIHNQAELNLCPSYATLTELEEKGFERLKIWSRGIDTERFSPKKRSREWRERLTEGHPDAPLLLYVGRVGVEKRIKFIRPVLEEFPEIRLAIVGDGPARNHLEKYFEGTNTLFTGFLTDEALASAYASADIFVFPAVNETFGNVVLEAMSSGLPVVAAAKGGQLDLVTHKQTGLLFDPYDEKAFIQAVRKLLYDRAYAWQLGELGRAKAKSHSWAAILNGLIEDYSAVTNTAVGKMAG